MRLGELWGDFVATNPAVSNRLAEVKAVELWPMVVGPQAAAYTASLSVDKGVLTAVMSSAAARSELFMRREALKNALNKAIGVNAIKVVLVK